MTPKKNVDPEEDDSLGVLDDTPSSDTTAIGLGSGTSQVSVEMPTGADDDDLVDDDTVEGELAPEELVSELILDTSAVVDADTLARIEQTEPDIVIELPAEQMPVAEVAEPEPETETIEAVAQDDVEPAEVPDITSEIVIETEDVATDDVETEDVETEDADAADADKPADVEVDAAELGAVWPDAPQSETAQDEVDEPTTDEADDAEVEDAEAEAADVVESDAAEAESDVVDDEAEASEPEDDDDEPEDVDDEPADVDDQDEPVDDEPEASEPELAEPEDAEPEDAEPEGSETVDPDAGESAVDESVVSESAIAESAADEPAASEPAPERPTRRGLRTASIQIVETAASEPAPAEAEAEAEADDAAELARLESVVAAAKAQLRASMAPTPPTENDSRPTPAERAEEATTVANEDGAPTARPASEISRIRDEKPRPAPEIELTSKRLDDLGAAGRESADLLTADRLLDPSRQAKPEPEGAWSHLLYTISGGLINIGDSKKARARKQLDARIAAPMAGTARFVPVLSRKGGVGKTTVTALLGMALADARDDRVIAVDANPDRGTLAERVVGSASKSVRDMVRAQHDIRGFHDISAIVTRDHTRLDVLASDADPRVSEAFGDSDYRDVAAVAAQYYSLVLTDSGTGIVHSVMGATLDLADQIIIVSGLSVDEARLASETLTWLETNGYADLAREAIVVLNQSTPGAPLVRLNELESHFSTRAKHVLRIPYDTQIAGGGPIDFAGLQPATRQAAREIAATLVEGLRVQAA